MQSLVNSLSYNFIPDESSEMKAAEIQRISEKIVQEIEKTFANENGTLNVGGHEGLADAKSKGCFSNFFGPDCRKLIESLMRRQNSESNTNSSKLFIFCTFVIMNDQFFFSSICGM
jgi:hypothetical protein